jgi:hypothetical protein
LTARRTVADAISRFVASGNSVTNGILRYAWGSRIRSRTRNVEEVLRGLALQAGPPATQEPRERVDGAR